MLVLADICDIFNYADNNTAGCYSTIVQVALDKLNNAVSKMLTRYRSNEMNVNSNTFQLIVFDRQRQYRTYFDF